MRILVDPAIRRRNADFIEKFYSTRARCASVDIGVSSNRFGQLPADGEQRIQ